MRSEPMAMMRSASSMRMAGGPARLESGLLVAAPDDDVGRVLDVFDLVAVRHFLVPGEVEHLRSRGAKRLSDREQHRVAQPASAEHDGFTRGDLRRRAGRAHE